MEEGNAGYRGDYYCKLYKIRTLHSGKYVGEREETGGRHGVI